MRASDVAPVDDRRSPRLAFVHTLFRDALYEAIPRSRRAALHRRIAAASRSGRAGALVGALAAELALHFELGGDESRAVHYLQGSRQFRLGDEAPSVRHAATTSTRSSCCCGGRTIQCAPRASWDIQIGLGAATMATAGFGAPPVEAAYSRARELSQQIGDTPGRFPGAVPGCGSSTGGAARCGRPTGLARDLRRRAGPATPMLRLQAARSSWSTAFSRGAFEQARRHVRIAMTLYDRDRHAGMAAMYGGHDPAVCGGMFAGRASAIMGLSDDAARLGDEAVTLARALDHPFSLGLALTFRAAAAQTPRRPRRRHAPRRRGNGHGPGAGVPADARVVPGRLRLGSRSSGATGTGVGRGSTRRSRPHGRRDRISSSRTSWRHGRRRTWPLTSPARPSRPRGTASLPSLAPASGSTRPSSTVSTARPCSPPAGRASIVRVGASEECRRRKPTRGEPVCAALGRSARPACRAAGTALATCLSRCARRLPSKSGPGGSVSGRCPPGVRTGCPVTTTLWFDRVDAAARP